MAETGTPEENNCRKPRKLFYPDRHRFDANVSRRDQAEFYLVPWRAAIQRAHVGGLMCSYNMVNGKPMCGNPTLDVALLRGVWNWTGLMISDGGAVGDPGFHTWAAAQGIPDHKANSAIAKLALVDAQCDVGLGLHYWLYLPAAVASGEVSESAIDRATQSTLTSWINTGALDARNKSEFHDFEKYGPKQVDTVEHRALSLEAGTQGMVLCKNKGNVLPLSSHMQIAVIGPHANATQDLLSNYHGKNTLVNDDSPHAALVAYGARVIGSEYGCVVNGSQDASLDCETTAGFAAAESLAAKADVTLVFVGLTSSKNNNPNAAEAETWDRIELGLPGKQEALITAVAAKSKRTVVILIHGGPLAFPRGLAAADAVLDCHYPGQLGGTAIAKTLFGDSAPAGRQTVTTYEAGFVNQRNITSLSLRATHNDPGITYRYFTGRAQWTFGHGLAYSTFNIAIKTHAVNLNTDSLATAYLSNTDMHERFFLVSVTNTGKVDSDFVCLGFVVDPEPGVVKVPSPIDTTRIEMHCLSWSAGLIGTDGIRACPRACGCKCLHPTRHFTTCAIDDKHGRCLKLQSWPV